MQLVWDLHRERPTLGGALVLRQEGECLADITNTSTIGVQLIAAEDARPAALGLVRQVFESSVYRFSIGVVEGDREGWPPRIERGAPGFSYFSFSRLAQLHATTGLLPRLRWNAAVLKAAQAIRLRFPGRLVCVHLKNIQPFDAAESNADGTAWASLFCSRAVPGTLDFILLGDDPLPAGVTECRGVVRAHSLGAELATQLALVSVSDAFLGMASGICCAANFSATPHVIFKHPAHHREEMLAELGTDDRFHFATPQQRLWRRVADLDSLNEALTLVLS